MTCKYNMISKTVPRHLPSGLLIVITALIFSGEAMAAITGLCASCHTMHNSQAGASVTNWSSSEWDSSGPGGPAYLLNASCVGCHTGDNTDSSVQLTNGTDAPYVLGSSVPSYDNTGTGTSSNTLAGGNFWWTVNAPAAPHTSDRTGHNVAGIAPQDATLTNIPPGGSAADINNASQLRCSGNSGCHGNRAESNPYKAMEGAHHGKTMTTNYRVLQNTDASTTAIAGLEDSDWEYKATDGTTAHNQYKGVNRSTDTDEDPSTISSFCASCHGNFHNGSGTAGVADPSWSSPWIRHPVDYEMPYSGEYQTYNGGSTGTAPYSVIVPVASNNVTSALSSVTIGSGAEQTIVMCLSCHRAHGTPYDSILRWDYKNWPTAGYNGCAVCHTAKN